MSQKPQRIGYIVALCGIMSALALAVMFVFGFVPMFEYITPAFAGVLIYVIREELGVKYGLVSYIAVGLLCLLITSNYEVAFLFIFLFGYYPILREYFQKLRFFLLRGLVKLAVAAVAIAGCYSILIFAFGMTQLLEDANDFGKYSAIILASLAMFAFAAYDIFLGYLKFFYEKLLKPKIRKRMH
ncbi:MAG: hypothetical protein J1F28_00760 [Oscillospiraceae bacterium]|nr:hypothetical protein [Oscillospiraceae bacterium]